MALFKNGNKLTSGGVQIPFDVQDSLTVNVGSTGSIYIDLFSSDVSGWDIKSGIITYSGAFTIGTYIPDDNYYAVSVVANKTGTDYLAIYYKGYTKWITLEGKMPGAGGNKEPVEEV